MMRSLAGEAALVGGDAAGAFAEPLPTAEATEPADGAAVAAVPAFSLSLPATSAALA